MNYSISSVLFFNYLIQPRNLPCKTVCTLRKVIFYFIKSKTWLFSNFQGLYLQYSIIHRFFIFLYNFFTFFFFKLRCKTFAFLLWQWSFANGCVSSAGKICFQIIISGLFITSEVQDEHRQSSAKYFCKSFVHLQTFSKIWLWIITLLPQ